jgi:hypothetical protein
MAKSYIQAGPRINQGTYTPEPSPIAPKLTSATAQPYYSDQDEVEVTSGIRYGLKGNVVMPRTDDNFSVTKEYQIFCTIGGWRNPDPVARINPQVTTGIP